MIVFGGNSMGIPDLNDVWRLNGSSWQSVNPIGVPPAPRTAPTAVYSQASNRMIVFGGGLGNSSPCANDVWVLTNANGFDADDPEWIQLSPGGGAPAPRLFHSAAYDPTTNTMIIFGGNNCFQTDFADVWVLSNADGTTGAPTWMQLLPSGGGPGARARIGGDLVYDAVNNILMIFGGEDGSGAVHNDVWVLSNANGFGGTPNWTQLAPLGSLPSARAGHSTVYDPTTNSLITFGGAVSSGAFLGDVWVLTNANGIGSSVWTQLGPFTPFAEPRFSHTAVYNPSTNVMTVFGGQVSPDLNTNDAWNLSDANGQ